MQIACIKLESQNVGFFFFPDSVLEDINHILNFIIMIGFNIGKLSSLSLDLLPACSQLSQRNKTPL